MTKTVHIHEIAEVNPRPPVELAEQPDLLVSFVSMANVGDDGQLHNGQERYAGDVWKGHTYFTEGDVLVAKITPCLQNGKAAHAQQLTNGHGFGSTEFHVLRPSPSVHGRYLFYMIWNQRFRHYAVHRFTGSAGQKRVPASAVADFTIPLPPLAEQMRIAGILDKADGMRRRRGEATQLADQLILSLFYETFGEWLRRPSSDMATLGDQNMADIASGVTKGRRFNGRETVVVPYIRVANVQDGFLDLSEIKTIEVLPSDVENLLLRRGDVLMTEGGDFDKLGRGAIWEHDIADCIHQNHIFRIRCNHDVLVPLYFANYIRTHLAKSYFLKSAKKTSNLATINMTQLRSLPVPLPPVVLQQRFVAKAEDVRRMQARLTHLKQQSDVLFNSLVQRAFRGEL